jgi:hypothetical protein
MRITFEQVTVKQTLRFRDPETGKPRQMTKTFMQTVNPFNCGRDGLPKSRQQIRDELNSEARLWKLRAENDIREGKQPQ